jgi:hypothetical protein
MRAKTVCPTPGCPKLTQSGKCAACRKQAERNRGTRQQRGYDAAHDRERRRWTPIVARGHVQCARCHKLIQPGDTWDLDHTEDRRGYLGPSHAACNRSAPRHTQ